MGLTDLLFKPQRLQVGTRLPSSAMLVPALVQFDASINEQYSDDMEATGFPVENGADITDHLRKLPTQITLEGIVTNTPLMFLASVQAESPVFAAGVPTSRTWDRVEAAYSQLRDFQKLGVLVDVITSLRTYSNMALLSISVNRDTQTGNALSVTMFLREIKIASAMDIDLPIPEETPQKKSKDKGKQKTSEATTQQKDKVEVIKSLIIEAAGG